MNNSITSTLLLISILLFSTSCNKDACEDVSCQENSFCFEGDCVCEKNYSGALCEIYTDPCTQLACALQPNTICQDGICSCEDGYTGSDCDVVIRNSLVGAYSVTDDCVGSSSFAANVRINGSEIRRIIITNMHNHFAWYPWNLDAESTRVNAFVNEDGIIIPEQSFPPFSLSNYMIEGSGSYTDDGFSLNYTITNTSSNSTTSCFAAYTN